MTRCYRISSDRGSQTAGKNDDRGHRQARARARGWGNSVRRAAINRPVILESLLFPIIFYFRRMPNDPVRCVPESAGRKNTRVSISRKRASAPSTAPRLYSSAERTVSLVYERALVYASNKRLAFPARDNQGFGIHVLLTHGKRSERSIAQSRKLGSEKAVPMISNTPQQHRISFYLYSLNR